LACRSSATFPICKGPLAVIIGEAMAVNIADVIEHHGVGLAW
jgi:hypothetical protein